jgi:predicted ATPase
LIRSVIIQNLRGIRDGRLDALGSLVVLVGPNGAGKSTVLDAVLVAASARPHEAAARVIQRHALPSGRRWLLWRGGAAGAARIQVVTSAGETRTCTLRTHGRTAERDEAGKKPRPEPAPAPLAGVPEVRLVEASTRGPEPQWHRLWEQAAAQGRGSEATAAMAALHPDLLRLEVVEDEAPLLYLVFRTHRVPVALAGDGLRRLLRLGLELAACPGGVVLIEEPEAHLHPLALRQSARAISAAVERGVQVILSTQSLELLDAVLAECSEERLERLTLYRLVLEDGLLRGSGMPGGDVAVLRKSIEEDLR